MLSIHVIAEPYSCLSQFLQLEGTKLLKIEKKTNRWRSVFLNLTFYINFVPDRLLNAEKDESISELDTSHPAYEWLERQADKIGAKGHFGTHGQHHIERDKMCEAAGCYVIENIRIAPGEIDEIQTIRVNFDLAYPSTGKPCTVIPWS